MSKPIVVWIYTLTTSQNDDTNKYDSSSSKFQEFGRDIAALRKEKFSLVFRPYDLRLGKR